MMDMSPLLIVSWILDLGSAPEHAYPRGPPFLSNDCWHFARSFTIVLMTLPSVFAIARHAVVDLTEVLRVPPVQPGSDRLSAVDAERLQALLAASGVHLDSDALERLLPLRRKYEPYVHALSHRVQMQLPSFLPSEGAIDDWERSSWTLPG